ncbi:thymidine phosphorylase [bacterium]|nr:thymidine phosphorylase [bacterium]
MHFQEILERKRDGKSLTKEEIQFFVKAYTKDNIPDYQASAFLMASYLNGLTIDETVWLTEAMLHSGIVVDLKSVPGIKVDKHSTGGVGDKTSLIIAPICAALGVPVPMISGRGLGHTGGTLDKLESIPGFNVNLGLDAYQRLVRDYGICLIGQTQEIAPADKKLYALRDVTCTVENKSLISASIMSKKLAEGIDALVLDVKTGCGAFMKTEQDSEELARLMMSIGHKMGKKVTALITDMNQTLGSYVGNALEVIESVDILKGQALPEQKDLVDLSILLSAHMIILGGLTEDLDEAKSMAMKSIEDGSAFLKFKQIVEQQGGDASALDNYSKLPTAGEKHLMKADSSGYIKSLNALTIGKGAVYLGAGRIALDSIIDPAVGLIVKKKVGDRVKAGETILEIRFNDESKLNDALPYFNKSIEITSEKTAPLTLIKKTILGEI